MKKYQLSLALLLFGSGFIATPVCGKDAVTTVATKSPIALYFEKIKQDPLQLSMFLAGFPKGGDLHNHFAGATYAENLIKYGKDANFCVNPQTFMLSTDTCPDKQQLAQASLFPDFYRSIVANWSMNEFIPGPQSSEGHFFATFGKFYPLVIKYPAQVLTEVVARAGAEHIDYLELMVGAADLNLLDQDGDLTATLAKKVGWDSNFAALRTKLLQQGLLQIVQKIPKQLDAMEAGMHKQLRCGTVNADPGCHVVVRYQYFALREMPPEQVFAALLTGFEAAKLDPRLVGINIVMAEDGPTAIKDYTLHMQMINFLHKLYPQVHISLHAGELATASVPPENLRNHIRQAVEIGNAERIGHGVDIAHETNAQQLLQEMAAKQVMVEINLGSNAAILGVEGDKHPLPLYLRYHVPVALSTDDEGVLRTDLTREYQRAVLTYKLDYATLKMLSRNSLTYSFLPGASLWQQANSTMPVENCQRDQLGALKPSIGCQQFLAHSEKATLQWQLEKQFTEFEKAFVRS